MKAIFTKKQQLTVVGILLLGLSAAFLLVILIINRANLFKSKEQALREFNSLLNQPKWERYALLDQELEKLKQKWVNTRKVTSDPDREASINNQTAIEKQITEIKRIFKEGETVKLADLDSAVAEYSALLARDSKQKLGKETERLTKVLKQEIIEKTQAANLQIDQSRQEIELQNQPKLMNLQMQLAMVALTENPTEQNTKKQQLQIEIARIHDEITKEIAQKRQTVYDELNQYEKQRTKANNQELNQLKNDLEASNQTKLADYRRKLETEYKQWAEKQQVEMDQAIEIRNHFEKNNKNGGN